MEGKELRESAERAPGKKKKYRRNFVDVLILFLIAASVVSFFFRGWMEKTVNRFLADDSTTVRFVIADLDADDAADFGNQRTFSCEDGEFGYLQDYEVKSASYRIARTRTLSSGSVQGDVVRITDPQHRNIVGTMLIQGTQKESGFYLDGNTKIATGMTFEIYAKEQKYTILVTKIG